MYQEGFLTLKKLWLLLVVSKVYGHIIHSEQTEFFKVKNPSWYIAYN